jgi:hypothetical protein
LLDKYLTSNSIIFCLGNPARGKIKKMISEPPLFVGRRKNRMLLRKRGDSSVDYAA